MAVYTVEDICIRSEFEDLERRISELIEQLIQEKILELYQEIDERRQVSLLDF